MKNAIWDMIEAIALGTFLAGLYALLLAGAFQFGRHHPVAYHASDTPVERLISVR